MATSGLGAVASGLGIVKTLYEAGRGMIGGPCLEIVREGIVEKQARWVKARAVSESLHFGPKMYHFTEEPSAPFLCADVEIVNRPRFHWESAIARDVRATVRFEDASGRALLVVEAARWGTLDQPSGEFRQSTKPLEAATFGIGERHVLNLAIWSPEDGRCFAINNDNFRFTGLRNPALELPRDGWRVRMKLMGIGVKNWEHGFRVPIVADRLTPTPPGN